MADQNTGRSDRRLSGLLPRPGRRASLVDRLKEASRGIFRRASTSNATPSNLEYDPKIRRKFSVITHEEAAERKLHTSQAHLNFGAFDWTQELKVNEKNEEDSRNEPDFENMSRPSSAGEQRKSCIKQMPLYAGHSETDLTDTKLDLTPLSPL